MNKSVKCVEALGALPRSVPFKHEKRRKKNNLRLDLFRNTPIEAKQNELRAYCVYVNFVSCRGSPGVQSAHILTSA